MDFTSLKVWQEAKELAVMIYKITDKEPICRDYSFKDQIRRSAISIASNIAEGNDRETDKEFIRFLYISKGSLAELMTQIEIGREIGYFKDEYEILKSHCNKISNMLGAFIRTLKAQEHLKDPKGIR
ncbi:MAG: four helix bundle protein [Clostridiales bacterium]|nr:four helix bundle protein [Clostridiales bacterium]